MAINTITSAGAAAPCQNLNFGQINVAAHNKDPLVTECYWTAQKWSMIDRVPVKYISPQPCRLDDPAIKL